ncbi:sensor histidine kinase [Jidongwangia harbinensis]|uniref:sensor histidine kinase n=1 Tax=Jidongwangia harbinensis TaxID=2878561 RepID=UPI0023430EA9|nr:nitrate- and nitrite sensing domain-containing protein [Jidongwangia harbinensis]
MRTRNWSIRSKIVALVAVPLTALLALWVFATTLTVGPAFNLLSANTLLDTVGTPGEVLVAELQRERRLSVQFLSTVSAPDAATGAPPALATQRTVTDRAIGDFRRSAGGGDAQDAASETLRARVQQIMADLDALPANRTYIDGRQVDPIGTHGLYSNIIDTAFQMFSAISTFRDDRVDREARALNSVGRGREYLARTDAMLAGANTAGRFSAEVRDELMQSVATSRFLLSEGVDDLPAADRSAYQQLSNGEAFDRLGTLQNTLIRESRPGEPSPVSAEAWQPAYDRTVQQLRAFELNAADALADRTVPVAVNILVRLAIAGLLGLTALIISVFVSVRVGRSIVGRLRRLRGEALEMADERLPTVVRRLQRGEQVDVDVETPPLEYGKDEIGQVGHAFNEVQRTAVQSAVEEAGVRRGMNEVFLNIARRSQTLLHRQLALLDKMERRETGPDELEDLYRVDHLATRMRRHAEDLVILAGAAPGRGWRNPVPVIDVVRGSISEVEDYKRVDILSVEGTAVLGRAVGDVIHLLAELLENAASFSPPHTRVQVTGQVLPTGYAIEIEDRGLGMSAEAVDEANRKLLEPPDFDPSDSARLGLFVVAQLANRHGIRVSLRPSAYGGITAVVLIPGELITAAPGPAPADQAWDRPTARGGAAALRPAPGGVEWQGGRSLGEALSAVTMALNGTAPASGPPADGPAGAAGSGRPTAGGAFDLPVAGPRTPVGGPSPSTVAEGLTPDGLVQRRRTVPRGPAPTGPASTGPASTGPAPTGPAPIGPASTGPVPTGPAPAGPARIGPAPTGPASTAPAMPAQRAGGPAAAPPVPAGGSSAEEQPTTAEGLPRRVRQASLAPQLRGGPAEDQRETQPTRSPEQVRSLMSALQRGTTRGRLAAAGLDPDSNAADAAFAEAATVSIPVVRDRTDSTGNDARDRHGTSGSGTAGTGDRGAQFPDNDVTRPEKDA